LRDASCEVATPVPERELKSLATVAAGGLRPYYQNNPRLSAMANCCAAWRFEGVLINQVRFENFTKKSSLVDIVDRCLFVASASYWVMLIFISSR
jgi:hypothetical protein